MFKLINHVFEWEIGKGNVKSELDLGKIKQALREIFDNSLPEKLPESVRPASKGAFQFATRFYERKTCTILPRHLLFLIKKYSLDGIERSIRDIASDRGITVGSVEEILHRAHRELRYSRKLKAAVLK